MYIVTSLCTKIKVNILQDNNKGINQHRGIRYWTVDMETKWVQQKLSLAELKASTVL